MATKWTDEKVAQFKQLLADGWSFSFIARRMGDGFTRNAVIGKAHRLNLTGPSTQRRRVQPQYTIINRPKNAEPKPPKPLRIAKPTLAPSRALVLAPPSAIVFASDKVPAVMFLDSSTCRFPIGHVGQEGFGFCGHAPREGSPYCEYHSRLAYQPMQDARRIREARAAR